MGTVSFHPSWSISQINGDPTKHEHLESTLTSCVVMWTDFKTNCLKIETGTIFCVRKEKHSLSTKYSQPSGFEWPSPYKVHMPGQGTSPSLFPDSQVQSSRPRHQPITVSVLTLRSKVEGRFWIYMCSGLVVLGGRAIPVSLSLYVPTTNRTHQEHLTSKPTLYNTRRDSQFMNNISRWSYSRYMARRDQKGDYQLMHIYFLNTTTNWNLFTFEQNAK